MRMIVCLAGQAVAEGPRAAAVVGPQLELQRPEPRDALPQFDLVRKLCRHDMCCMVALTPKPAAALPATDRSDAH